MPGSLPRPLSGTVIRAEDPPLQGHLFPEATSRKPPSSVSQVGKGDGEKGARPTRAGRCGQGNGPAISPPDGPSRADPSSLGPHLGPQRRWLVRPTCPISSHIRVPPVQEGRVQDISEVSAQFPLGLCRDTAAGPRGQTIREEEEKAGSRLRARGRPDLARPEIDKPGVGAGELSIPSRIRLPTPPQLSQLTLILRGSAKRHVL